MKKAGFLILVVIVMAISYYGYNKYFNGENQSVWSLVSEQSLLVFESSDIVTAYNQFLQFEIGSSFLDLASFKDFNDHLKSIDSIADGEGALNELLSGQVLISCHLVSNEKFGLTYYLEINKSSQKDMFGKLIEAFKDKKYISYNSRKYQNKTIYEITNNNLNTIFSYYVEDNIIAASFYPFLVEDVIRRSESEIEGFKESHFKLFEMPKLSNDYGNIYLNTNRLPRVKKALFLNTTNEKYTIGNESFLDLNMDDKGIYLNGFTSTSESEDLLSVFEGQKPISSNLKYFIPNSASSVLQIGFDNPDSFFSKLQAQLTSTRINYKKSQEEYFNTYSKSNMGESWLTNDMGIIDLDRNRGQLFFVNTSDINEALNELNTFGEQVATANGDSVYVEKYSTYEIRELEVENYINYNYWPYIQNWDGTYYSALENYIVFSNSIQNLKDLIGDINNENTWGRSVTYNTFFDKSLEEFNVSYILSAERYLESVKPELNNNWSQFLNDNQETLNNFNLASVQLSKLDDEFYTSVIIGHTKKQKTVNQKVQAEQEVKFSTPVTTKPFVVKNHISNLKEVLLQDSLNQLHLISNSGETLWTKLINGKITGDVEQIDFYNNNKLQYFFTTQDQIHILDRNGNFVEGYPVAAQTQIQFSSIIDYDNSKRYRFLAVNERGDIYLYSKSGDLLEGWKPRGLDGPVVEAPFHVRVRKKDCFVAVQNDGTVYLLNRRGETLDGFPLELEGRLNTGVNVKIGSDENSTIFSAITKSGLLIKFNMLGEIVETNQLYKPNKDSEFKIVSDALSKSYIVIRKDLNRVVILNEVGQELFAKDYLDAQDMIIQYYDFSTSNKLYVITDKTQGFTYLYNKSGKLINSRPINSDHEVGIIFSEVRDYLKVYSTTENQFRILQFN